MVIADVGETLLHLLRQEMSPDPIPHPEAIGLGSPAQSNDLALSLYFYEIRQVAERQLGMIHEGTNKLRYPPMTIDISLMITAHSSAELQSRALDEYRILGRAMQVLYDNAILKGSVLRGSLEGTNEELRLVMEQPPIDVFLRMFPNVPYKLSVGYSVGPIYIDSTRTRTTTRVIERDIRVKG